MIDGFVQRHSNREHIRNADANILSKSQIITSCC